MKKLILIALLLLACRSATMAQDVFVAYHVYSPRTSAPTSREGTMYYNGTEFRQITAGGDQPVGTGGGAPANMMTIDTPQTVTATKTWLADQLFGSVSTAAYTTFRGDPFTDSKYIIHLIDDSTSFNTTPVSFERATGGAMTIQLTGNAGTIGTVIYGGTSTSIRGTGSQVTAGANSASILSGTGVISLGGNATQIVNVGGTPSGNAVFRSGFPGQYIGFGDNRAAAYDTMGRIQTISNIPTFIIGSSTAGYQGIFKALGSPVDNRVGALELQDDNTGGVESVFLFKREGVDGVFFHTSYPTDPDTQGTQLATGSGFVTLTTAQTITGVKTFAVGTLKSGATSGLALITHNDDDTGLAVGDSFGTKYTVFQYDGVESARIVQYGQFTLGTNGVTNGNLSIYGNASSGGFLRLNSGTGGPGALQQSSVSGTPFFTWYSNAGQYRGGTTSPTAANQGTAGNVFAFLGVPQIWSAEQTFQTSIAMDPLWSIYNTGTANDIFIDGPISIRDSSQTTQIRIASIPVFPNGFESQQAIVMSDNLNSYLDYTNATSGKILDTFNGRLGCGMSYSFDGNYYRMNLTSDGATAALMGRADGTRPSKLFLNSAAPTVHGMRIVMYAGSSVDTPATIWLEGGGAGVNIGGLFVGDGNNGEDGVLRLLRATSEPLTQQSLTAGNQIAMLDIAGQHTTELIYADSLNGGIANKEHPGAVPTIAGYGLYYTKSSDSRPYFKAGDGTDCALASLNVPQTFTSTVTLNASLRTHDATYSTATPTSGVNDHAVFIDASSNTVNLTLTVASKQWRRIKVKDATNAITITPASGTIDGAASYTGLTSQYDAIDVYCDGTNFWIY